jgi:hypothetical protein
MQIAMVVWSSIADPTMRPRQRGNQTKIGKLRLWP